MVVIRYFCDVCKTETPPTEPHPGTNITILHDLDVVARAYVCPYCLKYAEHVWIKYLASKSAPEFRGDVS